MVNHFIQNEKRKSLAPYTSTVIGSWERQGEAAVINLAPRFCKEDQRNWNERPQTSLVQKPRKRFWHHFSISTFKVLLLPFKHYPFLYLEIHSSLNVDIMLQRACLIMNVSWIKFVFCFKFCSVLRFARLNLLVLNLVIHNLYCSRFCATCHIFLNDY